jgi:hypothetical protein
MGPRGVFVVEAVVVEAAVEDADEAVEGSWCSLGSEFLEDEAG